MVRLVLAQAGGEHDGIQAVHGRRIRADLLDDLIGQHIMRQNRARVALNCRLRHVAVIAGDPRNTQ